MGALFLCMDVLMLFCYGGGVSFWSGFFEFVWRNCFLFVSFVFFFFSDVGLVGKEGTSPFFSRRGDGCFQRRRRKGR